MGVQAPPLRAQIASFDEAQAAATIEIFDLIDPVLGLSAAQLNEQLKALGKVSEIKVVIHSRGGNAHEALSMYAMLTNHEATVLVDIIGLALSGASIVAMAGDRVRISEIGQFMIHDPWMPTMGNAIKLRRAADLLEKLKPMLIPPYKRRIKADDSQISAWMADSEGAGTWFDAKRCLELGIADEIFKAPPVQTSVDLEHLPAGIVVPEDVLARFGKAPEKPADPFAEIATALGEPPEQIPVLAEVLSAIREVEPPTVAVFSDADLQALEALVAAGQREVA